MKQLRRAVSRRVVMRIRRSCLMALFRLKLPALIFFIVIRSIKNYENF